MKMLETIEERLKKVPVFIKISEFIEDDNVRRKQNTDTNFKWTVYVVGGYVRDFFLQEESKDIDLVVIGSGLEFAKEFASYLNIDKVNYFENFGTANFIYESTEIEIVGARKESYDRKSRKPIVENGTLFDDLSRRDIRFNAMAISLNPDSFGQLIDPYKGIQDLNKGIISTPLNPDITFGDDPLRILRCIRFFTRFGFEIEKYTYEAIVNNVNRLDIISKERIVQEMNKILLSKKPSIGLKMLHETGLLKKFLPELSLLDDVKEIEGKRHKNNFYHTIEVVDQTRKLTNNIIILWAALIHDIGKYKAREFKEGKWTFHGHEEIGARMVAPIMNKLKLPIQEWGNKITTIVRYHGKLKELATDETSDVKISDSAIRRLIFDTEEHLDDLILFVKCDITTRNEEKRKKYLKLYALLEKRIKEVDEKDKIRNFKLPISGDEIMTTFNLTPSKPVGQIKEAIKNAILDGVISNDETEARAFMFKISKQYLL